MSSTCLLYTSTGADLYVLPEMFSTGFATNPDDIAESDGLSIRWMSEQARSRQCAMMGSVPTKEAGQFFNRLYFVWPDGNVEHYDKRHLFSQDVYKRQVLCCRCDEHVFNKRGQMGRAPACRSFFHDVEAGEPQVVPKSGI